MTAIVHVVPTQYADYVVERSATLSSVRASGIAQSYPQISALAANAGGSVVHLPHWSDLSGDDAPTPDGEAGNALTATDMAGAEQVAPRLLRSKVWRGTPLSSWLAGDDPLLTLADRVAAYRARREEASLFSILAGLFTTSGCLRATHRLDIATAGRSLSPEAIAEGAQLLGDAQSMLSAIAMHSAKATSLKLAGYLREISQINPTPGGAPGGMLQTIDGKAVVVDDSCPYADGEYTSYLFGPGAFAYAETPTNPGIEPFESDTDILTKVGYLGYNWGYVLHPAGCAYALGTAGANPTNTVLATATSWTKVFETKNIPLVAIQSK
jgi:hypothetical protein